MWSRPRGTWSSAFAASSWQGWGGDGVRSWWAGRDDWWEDDARHGAEWTDRSWRGEGDDSPAYVSEQYPWEDLQADSAQDDDEAPGDTQPGPGSPEACTEQPSLVQTKEEEQAELKKLHAEALVRFHLHKPSPESDDEASPGPSTPSLATIEIDPEIGDLDPATGGAGSPPADAPPVGPAQLAEEGVRRHRGAARPQRTHRLTWSASFQEFIHEHSDPDSNSVPFTSREVGNVITSFSFLLNPFFRELQRRSTAGVFDGETGLAGSADCTWKVQWQGYVVGALDLHLYRCIAGTWRNTPWPLRICVHPAGGQVRIQASHRGRSSGARPP